MADTVPQDDQRDTLIQQFCSVTGCSPSEAEHFLSNNEWDPSHAVTEYYTTLEEAGAAGEAEGSTDDAGNNSGATSGNSGRTLDGRLVPQAIPTVSSQPPGGTSSSRQPAKKKFATLGDLSGGGSGGHAGHGHDDDDDDDEEDQDFFAGGEKSALAVQNPDDLKRKIIEKARRGGQRPADEPSKSSTRFTGTARTLGGDDTPSQVIEDPNAKAPKPAVQVERRLHFWADGFSVDDGPLYRNDDPVNAGILAMIKSGRAPLEIMNVQQHQEVEVKLEQHQENYVAPKKQYKAFGGGGQRLGSPTPGPGTQSSQPARTSSTSTSSATSSQPTSSTIDIDESQPTVSIQIRLGDGTRLVSRFNTSHTIGDVYAFVQASSPASQNRPWVLMTTFPSKELSDKAQVLGDLSDFKRGGVVVQKWQ
ncbi:NSFL1 cofactor p47 [Xylographa opegraphella]|nr:NSFL1 cofactor p47 [Xylographa opegraphella]